MNISTIKTVYKAERVSGNFRLLPVLLLLCLVFSFVSPPASALDAPRLKSSDAYLVVDMDTGTELISLNPDQTHSIASLTKIMTCLLGVEAVESGAVSLSDMVTAQDDCLQGLDTSSSNAGITPGETMSFEDLLYCALVHSANDACNVIATHVAGSIPAFVQMMNARAAELGCENTQFVDTDGMLNRSEGHYSSPRDLCKIATEAMNHQLFARICGTADYTVSATNVREAFEVHNSNALLSTGGIYGDSYVYSGVSGIKTGFTKPAGYCLVSVCERLGKRLMCIVLGCNGPLTYTFAGEYQNFEDSITLYDWAFTNFESRTVFLAGEPLKRLSVTYAKDDGTVALCAAESLKLFLSKEITDQDITTEIHPYEDRLVAPITEGDELGYVDVFINGELRSTVRLLADASVEMERGQLIKAKIAAFFTSTGFKVGIIVLIIGVVLFFVFRNYRKLARRRILRARIAEKDRAKWTEQGAVYAAREELRRRKNAPQPSRNTPRQNPVQGNAGRRIPIETLDADRNMAGGSGQTMQRPAQTSDRQAQTMQRPAQYYGREAQNTAARPVQSAEGMTRGSYQPEQAMKRPAVNMVQPEKRSIPKWPKLKRDEADTDRRQSRETARTAGNIIRTERGATERTDGWQNGETARTAGNIIRTERGATERTYGWQSGETVRGSGNIVRTERGVVEDADGSVKNTIPQQKASSQSGQGTVRKADSSASAAQEVFPRASALSGNRSVQTPFEPRLRRKPVIHEGFSSALHSSDHDLKPQNSSGQGSASGEESEEYDLEDILNSFR